MSLGIVMLVHTAFSRAEQVARHWTAAGCPVVVHVDRKVDGVTFDKFRNALADDPLVRFCKRYRCEWGNWSLVAASQSAAELMLESFGQINHVFLTSGSCLPLRPVRDLVTYLAARPNIDFIESATIADVPWTVGGLDHERFTLRFPFSWKRHRYLFDRYVRLQRRLGLQRRPPPGLVPHIGSQWWCLTRQTLSAILQDPARQIYDHYFRRVWIPDESYFQTLARRHSKTIESRSLTLSSFDFQGKPHVFYDDHLQMLRRSDCFVARKIWPHAAGLYDALLTDEDDLVTRAEPAPGMINRTFMRANERRTRGRPGLYMQSRLPAHGWENGLTAGPYSVLQGFCDLFEEFKDWLTAASGACVHGHLFAPKRVEFANGQTLYHGALSDSAARRDYDPQAFLTSLIWNTQGEHQCFQFGPKDNQSIAATIARDPNAQISVIAGAWALSLFRSSRDFADLRRDAARLQKIESGYLDFLRQRETRARVRIWTIAECIEAPLAPLQSVLDGIASSKGQRLTETPKLADLEGFSQFLQNLRNQGMHPYLMGELPVEAAPKLRRGQFRTPNFVR
ncbi:DUF5927 domain-containing protein [Pontibaca salina]|uniref:Peptide O-xylosyltransferase n=1 Tax=Pontibaca salina TaxID=2795731 RepID=A0A934HRT9_9RHOB|nr:beta-1,6-N-acetylglucosaminyltransferase [Pontibaca salina]MBI6628464.1 glycosyl transferase [Pontibaca salina]